MPGAVDEFGKVFASCDRQFNEISRDFHVCLGGHYQDYVPDDHAPCQVPHGAYWPLSWQRVGTGYAIVPLRNAMTFLNLTGFTCVLGSSHSFLDNQH